MTEKRHAITEAGRLRAPAPRVALKRSWKKGGFRFVKLIGSEIESELAEGRRGGRKITWICCDDAEEEFLRLAKKWKDATVFSSSVLEMATHPAYQQIIGMGACAVPFILDELARRPDHWFWALKAITAEDPVLEEDRGDLVKMAQAWLRWAEEKGLRPAKAKRAKARRVTAK